MDAHAIEVEVELSGGLPMFSIIGLGDTAVHEARYRVQCALAASGFEVPRRKITVNLAPAALRKDGSALDLAMALAILVASGVLEPQAVLNTVAIGELSLTGVIRPVRGALPVAALARSSGFRRVIVPEANVIEASAVSGIEVIAPPSLAPLVAHLKGDAALPPPRPVAPATRPAEEPADLAEVKGQAPGRRALEIAAAGGHNLLFVGPPGSGKTMLARRVPSILPPLDPDEQIEVTKIWSAAGLTIGGGLISSPPFRAPHHTISEAALVGGGSPVRPGEVSLAHRGVLFLDEMPELPRRVLESLRQPIEDRDVTIARARHVLRMPAAFMLIGAANPCPCGWFGERAGRCTCSDIEIERYASRISGALLDRIDLVIEVPAVGPEELMRDEPGEGSAVVRDRVIESRRRAAGRGARINRTLAGEGLKRAARLGSKERTLLKTAMERLRLSARVLDRTLRVARTIADLAGQERVGDAAIAEALRYRPPAGWASRGAEFIR